MATDPVRIERPPTMQQAVLRELRNRILSRRFRPGDPIRPDVVAAEINVSRVPVREALKILEGEGQVIYRPHHGYYVTELRIDDLIEIYRIRQILESEATRVAIDLGLNGSLDLMHDAMTEMELLGPQDILPMTAANRRYHFALLGAAKMPHLLHHISLLWNATDPFRSLYYMEEAHLRLVHAEHREIYEAVAIGDADEAIRLLDLHRGNAIDALAGILEQDGQDS